jgi:hypothetical protein
MAPEMPVSGSGVELRFGIGFVSNFTYGKETHQS